MKKIIIMALLLTVVPVFVSAGALPAEIKLSKSVSATYFTNASAAGASDATQYSISTGHLQGNRVFMSSSSDAKIYYKDLDAAFTSGDLIDSHVPDFTSATSLYDDAL